jgi:hypothetical protein
LLVSLASSENSSPSGRSCMFRVSFMRGCIVHLL